MNRYETWYIIGHLDYSAEIDPVHLIPEVNEENNSMSGTIHKQYHYELEGQYVCSGGV